MINNYIINLTDQEFESIILKKDKPILIDFWAEWCGPCKMFLPILEEIAKEYHNRLIVAKVNIDSFSELAKKYSVRSIPTLLLFNNQKLISTHTGMISKIEIKKILKSNLNII